LNITGHGNPDNNLESPCTTNISQWRNDTVISLFLNMNWAMHIHKKKTLLDYDVS
jgi:hypothetical protein